MSAERTRRPSREAHRDEIMLRAANAMAIHGYHGMSMRDLARRTQRSLASVYNFFPSKEEILYELQRSSFEQLIAQAEEVLRAPLDAEARLDAFIACHVQFFVEKPDVMRVLVVEAAALPPARRAVIRALKQRYFAMGEALIRDVGPANVDDPVAIERAAYCVFGMMNWIFGWYIPERHGSTERLAQDIAAVARRGVAAALQPKGARS